MSNKAARNLFIFGSLIFFAIFLAMTFDTLGQLDKRAPEITQAVDDGKMVWHKYDCIGCHTIFGNGTYFAPDVTKIAARKPKSYLKQFLMDPKGVNPQAVMPKLGITSDEADNLIAFLDWISKVDTNGWPPKPILATAAGVARETADCRTTGLPVARLLQLPHDQRHRRNHRHRTSPMVAPSGTMTGSSATSRTRRST